MSNDDIQELVSCAGFLLHPNTPKLFGRLDFDLRSGVHIQDVPFQHTFYTYLEENIDTLIPFYEIAHQLKLTHLTDGHYKYYFIDFPNPPSRGGIPEDHRHFLEDEQVIVGFLLYKILLLDGRVGIDSFENLMTVIEEDYQDLHSLLYEKLGQVRNRNQPGNSGQKRLAIAIDSALSEFTKIAWFERRGDFIAPLPAFRRLALVYSNHINELFSQQRSISPNP